MWILHIQSDPSCERHHSEFTETKNDESHGEVFKRELDLYSEELWYYSRDNISIEVGDLGVKYLAMYRGQRTQ